MEGVFQRNARDHDRSRLTPEFVRPFDRHDLARPSWMNSSSAAPRRSSRCCRSKTAADARRYTSNFLTQTEHKNITRMQRQALLAVLPATLARNEMLEALDLTLSFEAWRRLRYEQGLGVKQAQDVLRRIWSSALVD